jgi:hypothetical protein
MPIPVVTCSADIVLNYSASPQVVSLGATATNEPILLWEWVIRSVPVGSTANIGTNGDFVDGISVVQNPSVTITGSVDGGYCFECIARNAVGYSKPELDRELCQQLVIVRTLKYNLWLPGDYSQDWGQKYIDPTLRMLESVIQAEEDPAPVSPSIYDDEFNGTSLDPKWVWLFAGAPTSGVESYNVANGKLNVTFGFDGQDEYNNNWNTRAHILAQVFSPSSDFILDVKLSCLCFCCSPIGIFMGSSIADYNGPFFYGPRGYVVGDYPTRYVTNVFLETQYAGGGAWNYYRSRTVSGINTYLRVTWINSTKKAKSWWSLDGKNWCSTPNGDFYDFRIGNNFTRIGLVFFANKAEPPETDRNIASVDFFRITLL